MTADEIGGLKVGDLIGRITPQDLVRVWRLTGRRRPEYPGGPPGWDILLVVPAGQPASVSDDELDSDDWFRRPADAYAQRMADLDADRSELAAQWAAYQVIQPSVSMSDAELTAILTSHKDVCPACNGDQLDSVRLEGAEYEQRFECAIVCLDCGASWVEIYKPVAGCNFRPGTER